MWLLGYRFFLVLASLTSCNSATANSTKYWLGRRAALIGSIFGYGPGVLSNKSVPDRIITWPGEPSLQGIVWDMTTFFNITSTVVFSPAKAGQRSERAFFFHHGHSDCVCPKDPGGGQLSVKRCRPGCNSSMPMRSEIGEAGYSWWDLYNVSDFLHGLGFDVFLFSMPLKGINLGPGSDESFVESDHWWFLQWELKGDHALRYFVEPVVLTANYAMALGYSDIHMAGLSGGGWTTHLAPAVDARISASFPIAGSVPCEMRNPLGPEPDQAWTGNDQEDFEQSCMPPNHTAGHLRDDKPGRAAFQACNYTCMYLLAGLEPGRIQVQILHEYDDCCFSPHGRHDQMLEYETNVRGELMASDRSSPGAPFKHGWFTVVSTDHVVHEVCAQDKIVIRSVLARATRPGSGLWDALPCDILRNFAEGDLCPSDVEPALAPHIPAVEDGYSFLGHGACRDAQGRSPAWGLVQQELQPRSNDDCARLCSEHEACDAYMSMDWTPMTVHYWKFWASCTLYCARGVGGPCTNPGNHGGVPSSVAEAEPLHFCWLKTRGRATLVI